MRYLAVLALPVLAYLDFYLTLVFARVARQGYTDHFAADSIELNPRWQADIDAGRFPGVAWVARVVGLMLLLLGLVALASWAARTWPPYLAVADLGLGMVLGMYAIVLGRHLMGIGLATSVRDHPAELEGRVGLTYPMATRELQWQVAACLVPLLLVAVVDRSAFAAGVCLGGVALLRSARSWRRQWARSEAPGDGA